MALSYAQLKAVWIEAAQGTKYDSNTWASLMAAIAEAESSGDPTNTNPHDNKGKQTSWGLWQISNGTHQAPAANWADPVANARLAIGKLETPKGLRNWGTYDTGAYKRFVSGKTAPDPNGIPATSTAQTAQLTAAAKTAAGSGSDPSSCAWAIGFGSIPDTSWLVRIFSLGTSSGNIKVGQICVLSKSQARALLAAALIFTGGVIILTSIGTMASVIGLDSPIGQTALKTVVPGGATLAKGTKRKESQAQEQVEETPEVVAE